VVSKSWETGPRSGAEKEVLAPGRGGDAADLIQPVEHQTADRIITGLVTAVPFLLLAVAAWQVWDQALHWRDLIILAVAYLITGLGVTVGFHRLLTHRSFKTGRVLRGILAAIGSAAIEGPVISWVADHRKHHAFADRPGDPHSPHVGHGGGWGGALRGLFHAHMGWLFIHTERGSKRRFAPDLIKDRVVSAVDRTFLLWAVAGLAIPFLAGYLLGGTPVAGLTALLWGGAVRVFLVHHVTYSVNSVCHVFGRRRFETSDESRNVFWLALPTMGEAWHNNHHAFPTSAAHGLRRWEPDPSAAVIWTLERLGLAWDVVRISPARQDAKAKA
jgi:stearoyl-CoA desaturase (Delta-9 desaturase)